MYRCLELAGYGRGFVAPNPMVGAVIVNQDKIIGEGFHQKWGCAHAEVNAINAVKDPTLLQTSTMYVNLEPCSHFGKTPPCAELIIEKRIPRVVIAQEDPFSKVSGKGIQMLKNAGIEVFVGLLKDESEKLNIRFITTIKKNRPYVVLKWAQSLDGFIDRIREEGDGQLPFTFSNDYTRILVHKLRAEESAIMVGNNTLLLDTPRLNVRYWDGSDPRVVKSETNKPLDALLKELNEEGIQSLIVEGGAKLLNSFIESGNWDEARVEINKIKIEKGVKAPDITGDLETVQKCENSMILFYKH